MIEQLIEAANVGDLVLILIVWAMYKVDIRSKNNRKIDLYIVVALTIIAVTYIIMRVVY